jgi:SAM-dependent methyltransferase
MLYNPYVVKHLRRNSWEVKLDEEEVGHVVARHGIDPWFAYVFVERWRLWHVWVPSSWLVAKLGPPRKVFETGCGCGYNLFWFGNKGAQELVGCDKDPKVIAAGIELAKMAKCNCTFYVDDAIRPVNHPVEVNALLALNWTYHVPEFDLNQFISTYYQAISEKGLFLIDIIDSYYNLVDNNKYLTSDWNKPISDRRPSEYIHRYNENQVESAFKKNGFRIIKTFAQQQIVPKKSYIAVKIN